MRLWHIDLIPKLPRQQLLGQWREIYAILGTINKRGKVNHSVVNYVNDHPLHYLYAHGLLVADEMQKRGYVLNPILINKLSTLGAVAIYNDYMDAQLPIYPEHDDKYMRECLDNLKAKGIIITTRT